VDDDLQILATLEVLLQPWGLRLTQLNDPRRLWDTLQATAPDLLILDVDMPYLNGIELCQVIRNDPKWNSLPVLFLSSHTDAATIKRVFEVGADDYVSKPIAGPELVTRIFNRLERIRLLRSIAETDLLTGVANRRKLHQDLEKFLRFASRHGHPVCFAILDLDHFKNVNDKYGHATGDKVLQRLGKLLLQSFRSEDVVARWGGEEFVVSMYGITKQAAVKRLVHLLEALHQEEFVEPDGGKFRVTFSAGVVQYPDDGSDLQSLYKIADKVLYQAKAAGRDRILSTD
jgi:diguanylate cyclase (GGDEF)-like protein